MSENLKQFKAKWRAHRGVLELDAILIPFVENKFNQLSESQKDQFILLMDQSDPVLQSWLIFGEELSLDHDFFDIINLIKK